MARMYPPNPFEISFKSDAERELYFLFRNRLGSEYSVVHSTVWHGPDEKDVIRDGEVDFVIIHPDHGLLVLEVKGGGIYVHGLSRRWYTVNRDGKKEPIKNPFMQTRVSMYILLRTLRNSPITHQYAADYRIGNAVWFPDVKWQRGKVGWLEGLDHLILDAIDINAPEMAVQRIYTHFAHVPRSPHAPPPRRLSQEAIDAAITLLNGSDIFVPVAKTRQVPRPHQDMMDDPHTEAGQDEGVLQTGVNTESIQSTSPVQQPGTRLDVVPIPVSWSGRLADAIRDEEVVIERLTQAQAERLAQIRRNPRIAIPGAAGTGKTVIALTAAYGFAREGLRVLVISPSKELSAWHQRLITTYWDDPRVRFDVCAVRTLTENMLGRLGWC